mmetsp:Transcript_41446/g.75089  ORF Transcript_41446/g.75089 Transcript_41446/m.75089 type:complete len:543 (+) Transcript_41446:114-1742(+)
MQNSAVKEAWAEPDPLDAARKQVRQLLSKIHVTDILQERSSVLAVDVQLSMSAIVRTVLAEQHIRFRPRAVESAKPVEGPESAAKADNGVMQRRTSRGLQASAELASVWPGLPSDVLAEACDLDQSLRRSVSSSSDLKEDLCRQVSGTSLADHDDVPVDNPVTIGEVCAFLDEAMRSMDTSSSGGADKNAPSAEGLFDCSLESWRRARRQPQPMKRGGGSSSRLVLANRSRTGESPVIVHEVEFSMPRPLVSMDDPDANMLKVVELLLAYPELGALPVVSPSRHTVVAHLTLATCLASCLEVLKGAELQALSDLQVVSCQSKEGEGQAQRVFAADEHEDTTPPSRKFDEKQTASANASLDVLCETQTLGDLLVFFQKTHHSRVPIVEEGGSGCTCGIIARRDVLQLLDLALQSASGDQQGAEKCVDLDIETPVRFDPGLSLRDVVQILQQHQPPSSDEQASASDNSAFRNVLYGATSVEAESLPLSKALLHVLMAANRSLIFVKGSTPSSPEDATTRRQQLLRLFTVSDAWQLLLGPPPPDR